MGGKWFGAVVKRKEDPALLAGRGRFIDDIALPGMLHAAFVRNAHPHAMIGGIDATATRKSSACAAGSCTTPAPMCHGASCRGSPPRPCPVPT